MANVVMAMEEVGVIVEEAVDSMVMEYLYKKICEIVNGQSALILDNGKNERFKSTLIFFKK